ncbi:Hemerythrin HHE cation binding domain-containing protein [Thermomonospora echinospora]|uniref:Hemerythrin HHE cation binding domain-containing protein n=1 Tax=Thermomonospora echinospora TaxID=1992 RepID=A0A1H5X663_9ACTN|nr:hemerythrin domain-containing protein [Thermomonospora echinospora]SEG07244.1 Hemerythrin HHE cation binding domain-containing protein [Thermomonospora echinospora]
MQDGQRDVIAVLTHDHRELEELFDRFTALPVTDTRTRREVTDQVIIELVRHAVAEEQYLYPAVRRHLPDGDRIADKEIADHAAAERTMKELERIDTGDHRFDDVFGRLEREVREHIAEEEDLLFPRLRSVCDGETLVDLGAKVERAKKTAPTRPHPSTPDTPPLNRLLDPGTGLVDRARDLVARRGR